MSRSIRPSLRSALVASVLPLALLVAAPAGAAPVTPHGTVSANPQRTASVDGPVAAVLVLGSTAYLGGDFSAAHDASGTVARHNAAAIDLNTGRLTSWNPDANGRVAALATQGGRIFLGGKFTTVGGRTHHRLAAVSTDGGAVTGFSPDVRGYVRSLAVGDSLLYVGGGFTAVDGRARDHLAAFSLASGALSNSWQPRTNGPVRALAVVGGRIYVGGHFLTLNGSPAHRWLGAVSTDTGATVDGFRPRIGYLVEALAATADSVYAATDGPGGHLRAMTTGGADRWNFTTDGGVQALTMRGDTLYLGGHFGRACLRAARVGAPLLCPGGSVRRTKLAAISTDGSLLGWAPQANSAIGVLGMDNGDGGTVVVGGAFTSFRHGQLSQPHAAVFS